VWFSPNFIRRRANSLIHEDASQAVQGGLPGEHYHISASLYQSLIQLVNNPTYSESITATGGESIFVNSGDIITVLQTATAEDITGGVPSIPDIVAVPVATPAPLGPSDPLWNYVVSMTNMGMAVGVTTVPALDNYSSLIQMNQTGAAASAAYKLFDLNLLAVQDYIFDFASFILSLDMAGREYSPNSIVPVTPILRGDFCLESWVSRRSVKGDHALGNGFYFNTFVARTDGLPNYERLAVHIDNAGNGKIGITTTDAVWSTVPSETATFSAPWVMETLYHVCLERVDGTITLYIDGTPFASITPPARHYWGALNVHAHRWGPQRITTVARYKGSFTRPTAPFPQGL